MTKRLLPLLLLLALLPSLGRADVSATAPPVRPAPTEAGLAAGSPLLPPRVLAQSLDAETLWMGTAHGNKAVSMPLTLANIVATFTLPDTFTLAQKGVADGQTLRWDAATGRWVASSVLLNDGVGSVGIGVTPNTTVGLFLKASSGQRYPLLVRYSDNTNAFLLDDVARIMEFLPGTTVQFDTPFTTLTSQSFTGGYFADTLNNKGYLDTTQAGVDFTLVNRVPGNTNLAIQAAAGQTVPLTKWLSPTGAVMASVDHSANALFTGVTAGSFNTTSPGYTGNIPMTAQSIHVSGGVVIGYTDSTGTMVGN